MQCIAKKLVLEYDLSYLGFKIFIGKERHQVLYQNHLEAFR